MKIIMLLALIGLGIILKPDVSVTKVVQQIAEGNLIAVNSFFRYIGMLAIGLGIIYVFAIKKYFAQNKQIVADEDDSSVEYYSDPAKKY